ncbi:hypothetical protein [Mesorhizobium sp. 1B3]|uniref:hypothetical protein n=1 Tax=Mesorhizobium sp. 1B3 TaxID=3243599 RepID=UPI003D9817F1
MSETPKSPEHRRIDTLIETVQQHPTDFLKDERRLTAVKWFEYRFLSPRAANRLFMRTYQETFRRKFAQEVDHERASTVNGVSAMAVKRDARQRSQLAAARQRADRLGISYPCYIEAAFDFALRRGDKRKFLPLPSELHGNPRAAPLFAQYVKQRWQEQVSNGLVRVEHPAYLIENYRGMAAQDDFRRFILDHVEQASIPLHRAILKFTYERKQIPAELFKSIVPQERFEQALAIVASDLQHQPIDDASEPRSPTRLWPTCFGMHYTHEPSSAECSACPQVLGCKKVGDLVLRKAAAQAGVPDPAGDYKRRMDRERQQRCRNRKREEKDAARFSTRPNTSTSLHP